MAATCCSRSTTSARLKKWIGWSVSAPDLPAHLTRHCFRRPRLPLGDGGLDADAAPHRVPANRRDRFAWVQWHWIAGILLTASVIFHIFHATFVLDFWSIWVGPKDIPEFKAEMAREMGKEIGGPKPGKYPLGNRLYHLAVMVAGLLVIGSGIVMMYRMRNGIVDRNPYMFSDLTWGFTYVLHGLMGVGFVGLVIAHIYFALRPEKLWITKSMLFGKISRREYLEHHDPDRWKNVA